MLVPILSGSSQNDLVLVPYLIRYLIRKILAFDNVKSFQIIAWIPESLQKTISLDFQQVFNHSRLIKILILRKFRHIFLLETENSAKISSQALKALKALK